MHSLLHNCTSHPVARIYLYIPLRLSRMRYQITEENAPYVFPLSPPPLPPAAPTQPHVEEEAQDYERERERERESVLSLGNGIIKRRALRATRRGLFEVRSIHRDTPAPLFFSLFPPPPSSPGVLATLSPFTENKNLREPKSLRRARGRRSRSSRQFRPRSKAEARLLATRTNTPIAMVHFYWHY